MPALRALDALVRLARARRKHAARAARRDHVVDVAALGRGVGVREPRAVVVDQLRAARGRSSASASSLRNTMFTAPSAPITATSAVGHAKLKSAAGASSHHVVRAAVRLARDHGQLRHGRLGVRVEQLRAVPMMPPHSWLCRGGTRARRRTSPAARRTRRTSARSARPSRRADVEHAGQLDRLVADDPDRVPAEAREAADDVLRVCGVDLEEVRLSSTIASMTRFMSYGRFG